MNLVQSLNVATPELPARLAQKSYPKLHPKLLVREHTHDGKTEVVACVPRSGNYYRFPPEQWALLQLFDGNRSYEAVAELYEQQTGSRLSEDALRTFAQSLDESGFWYKSPQEVSASFLAKAAAKRQKYLRKKKARDLAEIELLSWDPDRFLTKLHRRMNFVFSPWFTGLTFCLFAFMVYVFIARWGEISSDTLKFFNFTQKSFLDLLVFYALIFLVAGLHESAHGLTCKHYGGESHKMGALLVYLTPAFFCEVVEVYVYGGRWQRIATMAAGMWAETLLCAISTLIWWGTPGGTAVHEFTYMFVLVAGLASIVNVNPLIKTDGYYIFTELIGIPDLKETATSYVSAWSRKHMLRLPAELDFVSRRRRWFYILYAVLAGLYSYTLLLVIVRFTYNILYSYSPEWAFVPALCLAALIFKSRIRLLLKVTRTVYVDKKERFRELLYKRRILAAATTTVLLLIAPVWRESVEGRFVLEAHRHVFLRSEVPGEIVAVLRSEGEPVTAGAPVLQLRNLDLESEWARASSELKGATARATEAALRFREYGPAEQERQRIASLVRALAAQQAELQINSPIAGTIATPHLTDLLGSHVEPGATLAEVADLSTLQARIYIAETALAKVIVGADAALAVPGRLAPQRGTIQTIALASQQADPSVIPASTFQGLRPPSFYFATMPVANPNRELKDGMIGTAKIFAHRRSILGLAIEQVRDFVQRKVW